MSQSGEDPTTAYLMKRVEKLKMNTPALQRKSFTAESPHTCAQCEQEVFEGFSAPGSELWYLKKGLCHVLRTDPVSVYIYSLDPSIAP
jgi:hypothetical protein